MFKIKKKYEKVNLTYPDPDLIIRSARNILHLITLLRQQSHKIKTSKMDVLVIKEIEDLSVFLKSVNFSEEEISKAIYLLCAAMDESYTQFRKGTICHLEHKTLISYYYNEELGGDNFFKIIKDLSLDIMKNLPLIKLGYLLLALGFQGKYAIQGNGAVVLEEIRKKLKLAIKQAMLSLPTQKPERAFTLLNPKLIKPRIIFAINGTFIFIYYIYCLVGLHSRKVALYELIKKHYL